jgi:secreted trypsin-like serine protease
LKIFNSSGCGEHSEKVNTRIVGGRPADKGEWPWMAALLRDGTDQYCGGVLITDQHVLTASHCTDSYDSFSLN